MTLSALGGSDDRPTMAGVAFCTSCGTTTPPGVKFCPSCGTRSAPRSSAGPAGSGGGSLGGLRRWPLGQLVAAGSLVVLLIGLLIPWLSAGVDFLGHESENGFHGWGWLSFVGFLVGLAVLVARALVGAGALPALGGNLDHHRAGGVLVAAGGLATLGAVIFWAIAPTGSDLYASIGISAGVIVALLAGLALALGGAMLYSPGLTASIRDRLRQTRSKLGEPGSK